MIPLERERSLADADAVIRGFVRDQGWRLHTEVLGEGIASTVCTLYDGDGTAISNGFGKGEAAASLTGAMYEAVEHYYTRRPPAHEPLTLVRSQQLAQDPRYAQLPFHAAFQDQPQRRLACRDYRRLDPQGPGQDTVPVPLFMTYPAYLQNRVDGDDFDYASAIRFSSNSGVAIGASLEEAAVHAIGELVERDAWSLFLIAHYLGDPARLGARVDPRSLPDALARTYHAVRDRLGREVLLIDVTTDLQFPAFIATTPELHGEEECHPCGYGASWHAGHAATRALTELVQCVDIKSRTPAMREYNRIALDALSEYRKLRDCAYFKVSAERLESVDWAHPERAPQPPKAMLGEMVAHLRERGVDLYYAVNHHVPGALCIVSCVSFELERFFMVTSGIAMGPGPRGMDLLEGRLRAPRLAPTA